MRALLKLKGVPVGEAHLKAEDVGAAGGTTRIDLPSKPLETLSRRKIQAPIIHSPARLEIAGIEHRERGVEKAVKEVLGIHGHRPMALPHREHLVVT